MTSNLPVIDISGLAASAPAARQAVGEALHQACRAHGFFYCTGHGVPHGLIDAVMAETRAFFDLPDQAKVAVDKAHSSCNRGYEPLGAQTLQPGAPPDRKESFYIGEEIGDGDPRLGRFNQGPNQWPMDLPGFRPTMAAYFAALSTVGETLMRGLALSLALPEDTFADFAHQPLATLRLLHYPPSRPEVPDEMGAGAHTDFGGLTILLQDAVGGLQVRDLDHGGWIEAPPLAGAFVVNLGDMIARWTNDRYRSTLHRVLNRSGCERFSVPFFFTGAPDHEVRCIPTCLAAGEQPRYPPTTVEAHLQAMYARTYAEVRKE